MKALAFALILIFSSVAMADDTQLQQQIVGEWQYDGFFYQGKRFANPNPNLILTFTFATDNTARLYWSRTDEKGFCERKGTYEIKDAILNQATTWLNPTNDPSCGQDPDMQAGGKTTNTIDITDGFLNLHMQLNGEPFLYILKRLPDTPVAPTP